jgi:hypothetical protein
VRAASGRLQPQGAPDGRALLPPAHERGGVAGARAGAHGINPNLYHETITAFWLKRVRAYVGRAAAGLTLAEMTNALAAECGNSRFIFDYYSKELIDSETAKREWVEPDLRPLDF